MLPRDPRRQARRWARAAEVEQSDEALKLQFPRVTNQFYAKGSVRFLMNETKTGFLVKMTGGGKDVICPKYDFTVTSVPGETGTFGHQAFTDPQASSSWFDEQESELCHSLSIGYQEYAAYVLSLSFRDPASFAFRIVSFEKIGRDLGYQTFELLVPAILLGINDPVPLNYPTNIANLMRAQNKGGHRICLSCEHPFNGRHRPDHLSLFRRS